MKHTGRAIAFIDEANFAIQADQLGYRIDYPKLSAYLKNKYDLLRAYVYSGMDLSQPQIKSFALVIKRSGFRMVNRRGAPRSDGSFKSDIDVHLAVDMVSMADYYDTAILLSADGDFAPAIDAISRKGIRIEVISRKDRTADILVDMADELIDLRSILPEIGQKKVFTVIPINNSAVNPSLVDLDDLDESAKSLFLQVLESIDQDTLPHRLGDINNAMKQLDPDFNVRQTSFKKISKLAEFFEQQGALKIVTHADETQAIDEINLSRV